MLKMKNVALIAMAAVVASATAAPAARPTLSRRAFCVATTGKAFWLAMTRACSLSSRRGSVCGTATGTAERSESSQGPRIVVPRVSMVMRSMLMAAIRQFVAVKRSYIRNPD